MGSMISDIHARMMSRLSLIAFLTLTATTAAVAADWVPIDTSDEDHFRAFDLSRTRLISPTTVRTWKRYIISGYEVQYSGYQYSVTEWEINCPERKHRILSSFDYGANGIIVNTNIWKDSELRPIPPDSNGDVEATLICNQMIKVRKK